MSSGYACMFEIENFEERQIGWKKHLINDSNQLPMFSLQICVISGTD